MVNEIWDFLKCLWSMENREIFIEKSEEYVNERVCYVARIVAYDRDDEKIKAVHTLKGTEEEKLNSRIYGIITEFLEGENVYVHA